MPNLKNIMRYLGQYGAKSTLGLVKEKLITDPKRFSVNKKRALPDFPESYNAVSLPMPRPGAKHSEMHVLYLIHYFYPKKKGGTERFTLNLAKEQQRLGNKATVLVLEANEPESLYTERFGDIFYRYYEYDGIPCIGFRYKKAPLGLYYKRIRIDDKEQIAFAKHITRLQSVNIVHATYPQPFASFLLACKEEGIPYVVTCTDFCMMCHYSTMVDSRGDFCLCSEKGEKCRRVCPTYGCNDFNERRENAVKVLEGAKFVTVPSKFVSAVMSNEYPTLYFTPVSHGISEEFHYRARQGKVKRFVYAGTLSALKGVHMLVKCFAALKNEDISLDIYGEGDNTYVDKLKGLADGRVTFHGAVSADMMPSVYSEADCVIVPSMWYETYNFVLREAAATGALVLASRIGAMPEAIDEGENGYLFAPSDAVSLQNALEVALEFDFANYKRRDYPKISDEGRIYYGIYDQ